MSSGKNKRTVSRAESPNFFRWGFLLVTVAVVLYTISFFRCVFEPFGGRLPGVSRAFLLNFLLDPSLIVAAWFGEPAEFALFDRLGIFFCAGTCLFAATGAGFVFLRLFRYESQLGFCERYVFSTVLGLSFFSTFVHLLSLCGMANATLVVRIVSGVFCAISFYAFLSWFREYRYKKFESGVAENSRSWEKTLFPVLAFATLALPLVSLYVLTFPLPPVEYDVLSYHLPGIKETFQSGYFGFRTDSVYTNMPFGADMCYLWGMLVTNDWYVGALVGKTLLGSAAFLTALGLYSFCARFFSRILGCFAAVVYLAVPWVFYLSVTGLIDGMLAMYLFFAVYAVTLCPDVYRFSKGPFLAGLFTGGAIACKYPAVLFVMIPMALWLFYRVISFYATKKENSQRYGSKIMTLSRMLVCFLVAVFLTCGSWFVKNAIFTGNPTYPLLYRVFGDKTGNWTAEKNERWSRVHAPKDHSLSSLDQSLRRVFLTSEYHTPMLVPFGLLALIPICRRWRTQKKRNKENTSPSALAEYGKGDALLFPLLLFILFTFACWWLFTHRLDRFWVPVLPLWCILAARGMRLFRDPRYTVMVCVFLLIGVFYATLIAVIPTPGKYNRLFLSEATMQTDPIRIMPWTFYFNIHPPEGTLLLIGEAKAFDFECPVIFSSCFDDTIFEQIVRGHTEEMSPEAIRKGFHDREITDVYVDWEEIARFRSPGNYGFPEFVQQEVFDRLVREGVLRPNIPDPQWNEYSGRAYRVIAE